MHSFCALRSSEGFSNVDFSPRYLRGPRPYIFSALRRPLPEQCLCSCWSQILPALVCRNSFMFWEMNLPEQTGQMFKVTQGRSDGRTGVLTDPAGLTPSTYHSEKLLLGSHRSISTTLRDSFPSAPQRSFLLKERELSSNCNIVWKLSPIFIAVKILHLGFSFAFWYYRKAS